MATEESLRLFVALALPEPVRAALARWQEGVLAGAGDAARALRPVAGEGLHVTLCFLGAQGASAVGEVLAAAREALAGCRAAPLGLADPVWLPRRAPRVLAVGVADPSGALAAAQDRLSAALAAGGWYERERRAFLAHVTVARVARGAQVRARDLEPPSPAAFTGDRVVLFRSRLGRGGARYEELGSVRLGAGA